MGLLWIDVWVRQKRFSLLIDVCIWLLFCFFFSSRRRHTRCSRDWGSDVCSSDLYQDLPQAVLDEWRESAGKTWDDFISLVAEARDLSEDEVRATQARVYRADEALEIGRASCRERG